MSIDRNTVECVCKFNCEYFSTSLNTVENEPEFSNAWLMNSNWFEIEPARRGCSEQRILNSPAAKWIEDLVSRWSGDRSADVGMSF